MFPLLFLLMVVADTQTRKRRRRKIIAATAAAATILVAGTAVLLTPGPIPGQNAVIDGDTIYIDTAAARISAAPHTVSGDGDVVVQWQAKNADVDVTILFGYNGDYISPKKLERWNPHNITEERSYVCPALFNYTTNPKYFQCYEANGTILYEGSYDRGNITTKTAYWNVTTQVDWSPVQANYKRINYTYDGKNRWFYIENVPLQQGVDYKARIAMSVPTLPVGLTQQEAYPDFDGKYDIAFFPSSYGTNIGQAIADGNFYLLDPVVNLTDGALLNYHFNVSFNDTLNIRHTQAFTAAGSFINATVKFAGNGSLFTRGSNNDFLVNDTGILVPSNRSVSMWINTTGVSAGAIHPLFILCTDDTTICWRTQTQNGTNVVSLSKGGASGSARTWCANESAGYLKNNSWYHLFFMDFDDAAPRIWVNGTEVSVGQCATAGSNFNVSQTTLDIKIGGGNGLNSYGGHIDEITFWNKSLSAEEIARTYSYYYGIEYPYINVFTPIEWSQNVSNFTGNHNATPILFSTDFNATNTSANCTVDSYTSNSTHWPINVSTGFVNITGSNITKTGVYDVNFSANDTCGNVISQIIRLNITNNMPRCSIITNVSVAQFTNVTTNYLCFDPDGDTITYQDNSSDFEMNSSGGINFNITFIGIRVYSLYANDTVIANRSSFSINSSGNFSFLVDGMFQNITAELNTKFNLTSTWTAGEQVCFDIIHPSYGINTSCADGSNSLLFNVSYFERNTLNTSVTEGNVTFVGTNNASVNISAHAYDEVIGLSINLNSFNATGTYPVGVKAYINGTLAADVGIVLNQTSTVLSMFNDSATNKSIQFTTSSYVTLGYLRIPKNATVVNATITLNGTGNFTVQEAADQINTSNASGGRVEFLYVKPASANNNTKVWAKHDARSYKVYNDTLPAACWNYNATHLRLMAWAIRGSGSNTTSGYFCHNTTGWHMLTITSVFNSGCGTCTLNPASIGDLYDDNWDTGSMYSPYTLDWRSTSATSYALIEGIFFEDAVEWSMQAQDVWLEAGSIDGTREFNKSGQFSTTNVSNNMSNAINTYLSGCTADASGFCDVPLYLYSTGGSIRITNISIAYSYNPNPVNLNVTVVQNYVARQGNSTTNIPITFTSQTAGIMRVSNISYRYAGGNATVYVLAHTGNYSQNKTLNFTFHHSRWNASMPRYVDYLEFIPRSTNASNVTPYGQTPDQPIFNITNLGYGGRSVNYTVLINQTDACVNLSIGTTSNRSQAVLLYPSNLWIPVRNDSVLYNTTPLWMWADYRCNQTQWRLWSPDIFVRACANGVICGNQTS